MSSLAQRRTDYRALQEISGLLRHRGYTHLPLPTTAFAPLCSWRDRLVIFHTLIPHQLVPAETAISGCALRAADVEWNNGLKHLASWLCFFAHDAISPRP
jgi:hypothetical protein